MDKTCINCRKFLMLESRCGHETWPCESNRVCDIGRFEACEEEEEKKELTPYLSDCLADFYHGSGQICFFVDNSVKNVILPAPAKYQGMKGVIMRSAPGGDTIRIDVEDKSTLLNEQSGLEYENLLMLTPINIAEFLSDGSNWVLTTISGSDSE